MGTLEAIHNIETITAIIGCLFFGLSYLVLSRLLLKGWWQLKRQKVQAVSPKNNNAHSFCILVVCHNEATHLPTLLSDLEKLEIQPQTYILVDDHSNDGTYEIIAQWKEKISIPVEVIRSKGRGKKQAIEEGLANVETEWVLTTDADCRVPSTWSKHACEIYAKEPFDLLIMPVDMHYEKGLFSALTRLEFITLVGAGMGLAASGHPIMCNGANMAFSVKGRKAHEKQLHKELVSGDDVFLLHALKQEQGKIRVAARKDGMVMTAGSANLHDFLHQRARWASKATYYTDKESIAVACCIFGISLWQIVLYVMSFFSLGIWPWAIGLFLGKWICDVFYLHSIRATFSIPHLLGHSLLLSLFYPFYIVYSALVGMTRKKVW